MYSSVMAEAMKLTLVMWETGDGDVKVVQMMLATTAVTRRPAIFPVSIRALSA